MPAAISPTDEAEVALDRGARRLRFPREFEQVFLAKYYRESIAHIRLAVGLGVVVYMLFGLVDVTIAMPERLFAEVVRYGIVSPFLLLVLLLSFRDYFRKIYAPLFSLGMLIVGLGVVTTTSLHDVPDAWYQQTSLMLVLLFNYTFTRIRFWYATTVSVVVTIVALAASWFVTRTPTNLFVYTALCLVSANIFGMFSAYLIEYYQRRHFLEERRRDMEKLRFKRLSDELRSANNSDSLTNIANRLHFEKCLERAYRDSIEKERYLTVFLVDIDHFKEYNQIVGHREGDLCLKTVAQTLAAMPHRPGDLVARYAGAEFAILLPNTDAESGRELIEALVKSVAALGIRNPVEDAGEFVTVSAGGVCVLPQVGGHGMLLLDEGREMLKRAREHGRSRVVMSVDPKQSVSDETELLGANLDEPAVKLVTQ